MALIALLFNFSLIGAAAFAAYSVTLEHPFAFAACAFAFCHGLFSMIQSMKAEESRIKEISDSIMEILPLALVNIELYATSESKDFAKAHLLFIIPLTYDLIARLFTEEGEDSSAQALKDITIFANTVSLCYLAFSEGQVMYAVLAGMVIFSKYLSFLGEYIKECASSCVVLICDAGFYIALALALGEGGGGGGGGEGGGEGGGGE